MAALKRISTWGAAGAAAWLALRTLRTLDRKVTQMGTQLQDLRDEVGRLTQSVNDTKARVASTQSQLQQAIDSLQAHPAADDLTDIIGQVQAARATLDAIDAAPATPTVPVTPAAPADTSTTTDATGPAGA